MGFIEWHVFFLFLFSFGAGREGGMVLGGEVRVGAFSCSSSSSL